MQPGRHDPRGPGLRRLPPAGGGGPGRVHRPRDHEEGPPRLGAHRPVRPGTGGGAGPENPRRDHHQRPTGAAVRQVFSDTGSRTGPDPVGPGGPEAGPGLRPHPCEAGVRGRRPAGPGP